MRSDHEKIFIILFFLSIFPAFAEKVKITESVRVYIVPAETNQGFVDTEVKGKQESINYLTEQLKKKKALAIVDTKESADMTVEVIGRATGDSDIAKCKGKCLIVRIIAKDYNKVESINPGFKFKPWDIAVKIAANMVAQFAKDNYAQLIAGRK